ncbi:hypothetical protein ACROYT_G007681, partial [Oculina patagonica]
FSSKWSGQVELSSCSYTMKYAVIFSLVFLAAVIVMAKVPFKMNNRDSEKKTDFDPFISKDAGYCEDFCEGYVQEECYCPEVMGCHNRGCPMPKECVDMC